MQTRTKDARTNATNCDNAMLRWPEICSLVRDKQQETSPSTTRHWHGRVTAAEVVHLLHKFCARLDAIGSWGQRAIGGMPQGAAAGAGAQRLPAG